MMNTINCFRSTCRAVLLIIPVGASLKFEGTMQCKSCLTTYTTTMLTDVTLT